MEQKVVPLSDIFDVSYGTKLDFNKMVIVDRFDPNKVCFISRTSKNLGLVGYVERIDKIEPLKPGLITVTLGGTYLLSAFIQNEPFYTAQNIAVLSPKYEMSFEDKLFYCLCIGRNRYRYSAFGREANRTLKNILVPKVPQQITNTISNVDVELSKPISMESMPLDAAAWKWFKYSDLFTIDRGKGPRLKDVRESGAHPFVTSTDQNNGWNGWTDHKPMHNANVITVTRNGSVGEAFYQPVDFCSTEDVHIFNPKFHLTPYIAIFLTTLIRKERYRYNYGRKWGIGRMNDTLIKLPALDDGSPNWQLMEDYIKTLPYSKQVMD